MYSFHIISKLVFWISSLKKHLSQTSNKKKKQLKTFLFLKNCFHMTDESTWMKRSIDCFVKKLLWNTKKISSTYLYPRWLFQVGDLLFPPRRKIGFWNQESLLPVSKFKQQVQMVLWTSSFLNENNANFVIVKFLFNKIQCLILSSCSLFGNLLLHLLCPYLSTCLCIYTGVY